jgi:hypothetical protein
VVILHEAANPYAESSTITGNGTMVAFIGASGESPTWGNSGMNASLRADNNGVAFVHNVGLRESTSSALAVTFGGTGYVTSSQISNSNQSAISISDGTLFVQNSFVGVLGFNAAAISVTAGTFEVEYSTLGTVGAGNSFAISCANGTGSSIRNSIALTITAASAAFTDPLSTFATWTTGDPLVDIDGDPRVGMNGQLDYAGADVPR